MRLVALVCLAVASLSTAEPLAIPLAVSVTVVLDFEQAPHSVPLATVQQELRNILAPSGLRIDVRVRNELPRDPEFQQLVIFKMKGHCTTEPVFVEALSDERGALAMTYTSDGELLPFGEVECDGLRRSLARVYGPSAGDRHSIEFGTAVARVMAHEIYHMIGNSKTHTRNGISKESLSARELSGRSLQLDKQAQAVVRDRVRSQDRH